MINVFNLFSNKSLHVSSGISKSHSSLNVPARKIQQKQHETQINQQFPGQQAILTDESGRLILSADDADSMITITGDDGMLYQVRYIIYDAIRVVFSFVIMSKKLLRISFCNIIFIIFYILFIRFLLHN